MQQPAAPRPQEQQWLRQQAQKEQQQQQHTALPGSPKGPVLLGEVIPCRSGLDGGAPTQTHSTDHHQHQQQQQQLKAQRDQADSSSSSTAVQCPTSAVLEHFTAAAAQFMPPFILMSRWVKQGATLPEALCDWGV
jgi:hypothetical protein